MRHTPLEAQRKAIEAPLGPTLVIAGPGAGKTFCLIERIHYLIKEKGFAAQRILAVTFTNKAAEEIAARLRDTIGLAAEDIARGTLHSFCVNVLRDHADRIGLSRRFGIADDAYQTQVLRSLGVHPKNISQLLTTFGTRKLKGEFPSDDNETIFRRYCQVLRDRDVFDFDDLILNTWHLFETHPDLADQIASAFDYVLIDEFQDLNKRQFEILTTLARKHRNVFAVGDDEQSIFSWTGADPGILVEFQKTYGIANPIVLDQNQRCSIQIYETARRLLDHNPSLFDKEIRALRNGDFEVAAHNFDTEHDEVAWMIEDLQRDREANNLTWGEYGILYRQHKVGRFIEQSLVNVGIPCRLAKGRSLQDDPAIAYVVASIRIMAHPQDNTAVEVFAQRMLPESLVAQIRADMDDEETFLSASRRYAIRQNKQLPDTKKAWRLVYHIENLAAMRERFTTIRPLVDELLTQRVGKYRNVLEDAADKLDDPADSAHATSLADSLTKILNDGGSVWIPALGGMEFGLRGMLFAAGFSAVQHLAPTSKPASRDVVLDKDMPALPLVVFHSIQLTISRNFTNAFTRFVAFDLETTDNDVAGCDIIEVGAVRVVDGKIVGRYHELVKPNRKISARATAIHGYHDADVENAPTFGDVWPAFRDFIGRDVLVAHNGMEFDVPVLRRAAASLDGIDSIAVYDSLPLARSLFDTSARLTDLASRFGIDTGRSHHASDDAETLAHVFVQLHEAKLVRARKAAAVNLLDYLGLTLALATDTLEGRTAQTLFDIASRYTLGRYGEALDYYRDERARHKGTRAPSLEDVIEQLGGQQLMNRLRSKPDPARRYPEAVARIDALVAATEGDTLAEQMQTFLDRVALSTSQGAQVDPYRVNLLTLHATKGLEFSRVYIVGAEDFQLPGYYQTIDNREGEIQEGRRLLYVGMTRAIDRLVLTKTNVRAGSDTGGHRFLTEMGLTPTNPTD